MRINRFLSQAGLGSRRHVEQLIEQGRVLLNGKPIASLALRVGPADRVEVDGERVRAAPPSRWMALHKPVGVVCSLERQGTSPCLADVLPAALRRGRLFHVGRLDRDSSGLLLLTDDGVLANRLLHPSHPVWKEYEVDLDRRLESRQIALVRDGRLVLDGRRCAPALIELPSVARPQPPWRYRVRLREGRNRQIRRMMDILGARVLRLHRVAVGPLRLGQLPSGSLRALTAGEIARLSAAASGASDAPARPSAGRPSRSRSGKSRRRN